MCCGLWSDLYLWYLRPSWLTGRSISCNSILREQSPFRRGFFFGGVGDNENVQCYNDMVCLFSQVTGYQTFDSKQTRGRQSRQATVISVQQANDTYGACHKAWLRQQGQTGQGRFQISVMSVLDGSRATEEYAGACSLKKIKQMCLNEWMKMYKRRLTISTPDNVCSQRQVPPQAKNTITLGQHNPQKLTQKNPDQNHRHT